MMDKISKTTFFLMALVFLLGSCSQKQENPIAQIDKAMAQHRSVHYKILEKYTYSYTPDTTVTPYEIWAVKDSVDKLHHGYVWINNYYRPYNMIYDRGNFYLVIPPKKTTLLYKNFSEDFISPVDWVDVFLQSDGLQKLVSQPGVQYSVTDVTFENKKCFRFQLHFKKEKKEYVFIIDKKQQVPLLAKMKRDYGKYTFTEALYFSGFQFDGVNKAELQKKEKEILAANPVQPGTDSEISRLEKMLHVGDKAPLFDGKFFASGKPFQLKDYIGKKVIIVDFWYTHCPPCVRAIPELSKLYTELKDKGLLIFGLNSVDNRPASLANLKNFIGRRNISYPIILTRPSVDRQYKINGYPSMYVIDKQGKIAFVDIGFDQAKLFLLKQKVEKLLR